MYVGYETAIKCFPANDKKLVIIFNSFHLLLLVAQAISRRVLFLTYYYIYRGFVCCVAHRCPCQLSQKQQILICYLGGGPVTWKSHGKNIHLLMSSDLKYKIHFYMSCALKHIGYIK